MILIIVRQETDYLQKRVILYSTCTLHTTSSRTPSSHVLIMGNREGTEPGEEERA